MEVGMKIYSAPKRLKHSNNTWRELFAFGRLEVFDKRLIFDLLHVLQITQ